MIGRPLLPGLIQLIARENNMSLFLRKNSTNANPGKFSLKIKHLLKI